MLLSVQQREVDQEQREGSERGKNKRENGGEIERRRKGGRGGGGGGGGRIMMCWNLDYI